ncbi:MAG: hypothetical protein ACJ72B_04920 [Ornithinibacter sp.]
MAAVEATVFVNDASPLHEAEPVPRHAAHERVGDVGEARHRQQEAVPTAAGVLGETTANRDLVDRVTSCAAPEPEPFADQGRRRVWVGGDRQEQGVPTADAAVLVVVGAPVDA